MQRTPSKQSIRRAFDRAGNTYARAAGVQAQVARDCAGHVPPGRYPAIMEIGAGGGVLTTRIAERCGHDRYVAVDIAPAMLAGVDATSLRNPELRVADGEGLDFPAGSFDLLVSSSVMQWYKAPEVSIPANLGLLRSGGRFSISIYVQGTLTELAQVSAESGFGSTLPLRPADFYVDVFRGCAPTSMDWKVVTHVTHHPSVSDMLRTHRATGATATSGVRMPSKHAYKRFIDCYEERFREDKGVRTTSVVLHLWGVV